MMLESSPEPGPSAGVRLTTSELLVATWGTGGVLVLLAQAIYRLGLLSWEAMQMPLSGVQMGILALWVVVNAYSEGYRAFQKRFSPRVVARALHLARNPEPLHVLLGPAYCMGFFHGTPRAKWIAWLTTLMVIGFIVLLRQVPQPWRGIVDSGVVIALVWGSLAIGVFFVRAVFLGKAPAVDPELPR